MPILKKGLFNDGLLEQLTKREFNLFPFEESEKFIRDRIRNWFTNLKSFDNEQKSKLGLTDKGMKRC